MKTRTSIYHRHFAFAYVPLVAVIFCSCGNETTKKELTSIDKIYPIIDKIESCDSNVIIKNVRLYAIDSCEYIGDINGFHSDVLTHKGNCKFCAERSKK